MKGKKIVAVLALGALISCSESSDPSPAVEDKSTNEVLESSIQGTWQHVIDEKSSAFNQITLSFDGDQLHWKDSTVNNGGKYAIVRSGSCDVLYLKKDDKVVEKYLMGGQSITPGLTDVIVSDWRGTESSNRNYRNVNSTDGWELINSWKSSGAQPPIPEGVYAEFKKNKTVVNLEIDGKDEDFKTDFSRPQ